MSEPIEAVMTGAKENPDGYKFLNSANAPETAKNTLSDRYWDARKWAYGFIFKNQSARKQLTEWWNRNSLSSWGGVAGGDSKTAVALNASGIEQSPKAMTATGPHGGPDHSYASDTVSILLDQTVLQKFVGESGLVYYKCAFEKLIDAYGIGNSKLSDVDDKQLRQIAFRRGSRERWNVRLPFVKDTTWNWSAFFFGIFWAVWRGIAYKWWIFAVWVVGVVINSGSVVLPSLAVAIFLGANGNSLFLNQALRELKLGSVRTQLSFARQLWVLAITALILLVGFGFNVGGSAEPDCGSANTQNLVTKIAKDNRNTLSLQLLQNRIRSGEYRKPEDFFADAKNIAYKLGAIRMKSKDADTKAVSCAAKLHGEIEGISAEVEITYQVEKTSDGDLYATVYGLK